MRKTRAACPYCGYAWGGTITKKGCEACHTRHAEEVNNLNKNLNFLVLQIEKKKEFHEIVQAKCSGELLKEKVDYEKSLSELSPEINKLKADNMSQQKKVQFLQVRHDSLHGDVLLAVPGLHITAHRTILAAKSPLFKKVVPPVIAESAKSPTQVINMGELSPPVLEAMVDFCYSGEITFSELMAPDEVLRLAHIFELRLLTEYCAAELSRRLTVDNVPQMLKLSRKFEAKELQEAAGKLFKENFDMVDSKVYEVLEGPDSSTPYSQCSQAGGWELHEKLSNVKVGAKVDPKQFSS